MIETMPTDSGLAAFGSSFTAITLAELGDKTFFMALILAARHRARWVFIGASAPSRRSPSSPWASVTA